MAPQQPTDCPRDSAGARRIGKSAEATTTSITIDGEKLAAVPGESLAATLIAAGKSRLRDDSRGKPRGLLCGMGACFECRVSVNGNAPQRACLTPVTRSMDVQTLSYREALPTRFPAASTNERQSITCDVLIIGAGPAGASAAIKLANAGKSVVIVDERHEPGGQYFKQKIAAVEHSGADDRQYRDGRKLLERLRNSPTRILSSTTVWGAFRDDSGQLEIGATTATRSYSIYPDRLIVASGACESVPPFPGWTLPGVMTTGAAQSLLRAYRVAPGQRVLIAGNGPLNLQLACELIRSGINVIAVAESAQAPLPRNVVASISAFFASPALCLQGLGYLRTLHKSRVPIFYGHQIYRAEGADAVQSATIAALDPGGNPAEESAKTYDVDTVCLGYRQISSAEILQALGCKQVSDGSENPAVGRDDAGETSVPGVFAIGDGATPRGAQVAIAEGNLLADAILGLKPSRGDIRRLARHRRFQRNLWSMFEAPEPAVTQADVIVCRCEAVGTHSLRRLLQMGVRDIGSLKRLSRAGMGLCQGRYCQKTIRALMRETDAPKSAPYATFAAQNPVKPVTIENIATEKPEWQGYQTSELPMLERPAKKSQALLGETDVLIIGAGIIGTAAALFLGRAGTDVMLAERGVPNGESSGSNAGSLHLQLLPFDYHEGEDESPAAVTLVLQKLGIDLWQKLEVELQANFELSIEGGLMFATGQEDLKWLHKKAAVEKSFGVDTQILSAGEARKLFPGVADDIAGAAYCCGEGKINPLVATPQLLSAAMQCGARLAQQTTIIAIEYTNNRYRVSTDRGVITCNKIINATGGWSAGVARLVGASLPVKSAPQQMLVTQPAQMHLPFLLSLAQRHLTMKQTQNGNILIGGGWPGRYDTIRQRAITLQNSIAGNLWVAQRVLPQIGSLQLIRSWATTGVMIDGAPIIGELPGCHGFYNVVGANGYTMGPILGRIVADLILTGHAPLDIAPYSIERFN